MYTLPVGTSCWKFSFSSSVSKRHTLFFSSVQCYMPQAIKHCNNVFCKLFQKWYSLEDWNNKLVSKVSLGWREMGQERNKIIPLKPKKVSEMNIENSGYSWNPYSTFISSENNSFQDEHWTGFQDWPWNGEVKLHMHVTECFILEKARSESFE